MRLDDLGGARHGDMRVHVDGHALRPRSRPGLPCLRAAVVAYLFQTFAIAFTSIAIIRESG